MKSCLSVFIAVIAVLSIAGCETVRTTDRGAVGVDRPQHMSHSSAQVNSAAAQAYQKIMQQAAAKRMLNRSPTQLHRVRTVANRLIRATGAFRNDAPGWRWEVNVISSPEVNAWCMPGGKIAVYTGLISKLAITDAELAAVMGHEIAHALREHGREKASQQATQSVLVGIAGALLGLGELGTGLAGTVANVTIGLPNSREFEREADRIGVELAARAGYDPRAAISLWQKMSRSGSGGPPQFLSTHPSAASRIEDLRRYANQVMPIYQSTYRR
jgi:predicted Zn-dependent protease